MACTLRNIRSNFFFDEMPVDNIIYARKGGCFITFLKGTVLTILIFGFGCLVGILICNTVKVFDAKSSKLLKFLNSSENNAELLVLPTPLIIIKNYKILIHPIFNDTSQPFTYYGTIWITFTPNTPNVAILEFNASPNLNISENNLFVYRSRTLSLSDFPNEQLDIDSIPEEQLLPTDENAENIEELDETVTISSSGIDLQIETFTDEAFNGTITTSNSMYRTQQNSNDVTEIFVTSIVHDHREEILKLYLGSKLKMSHYYIAKINFSGNMLKDNGFMYTSYENAENTDQEYLAAKISKAKFTSSIFPCINNDRYAATYDLSMYRNLKMKSISSSQLRNTEMVDSQWVLDNYQRSKQIKLSDFGFALTQLEPKIINVNKKISFLEYLRPLISSKNISFVESLLPGIVADFELATGTSNYVNKIIIFGMPHTPADTIETKLNLIFVSETYYIPHDDADALIKATLLSQAIRKILYEPLTPFRKNQLWLSEIFPLDPNLDEAILHEERYDAFQGDLMERSTLSQHRKDSENENNDIITQSKGFCVLEIVKTYLTELYYKLGITEYYKQRAHTPTVDFFTILGEVTSHHSPDFNSEIFSKLIKSWTTFTLYPVLMLNWAFPRLTISQKTINEENRNIWIIPFSLVTSSENVSFPTSWLTQTSMNLIIEDQVDIHDENFWILIYPSKASYYRVNYDESNWLSIIKAIQRRDHQFSVTTRATLADDAFNLARYGHLNYAVIAKLINCWKFQELKYLPWKAVLENLNSLYDNSLETAAFPKFRTFIADVIQNIYRKIVLSPVNGAPQKLKNLINQWACIRLGLSVCIKNMKREFSNLLIMGKLTTSKKPLEEIGTLFCTAIKHGGDEEWNYLLDSLKFNVHSYNRMIIQSLACTSDVTMINVYLNFINNSSFVQYIPDILKSAAENAITRGYALQYVYKYCSDIIRENEWSIFVPLFGKISTDVEFQTFQDQVENLLPTITSAADQNAIRQIVQRIQGTLKWKNRLAETLNLLNWEI